MAEQHLRSGEVLLRFRNPQRRGALVRCNTLKATRDQQSLNRKSQ